MVKDEIINYISNSNENIHKNENMDNNKNIDIDINGNKSNLSNNDEINNDEKINKINNNYNINSNDIYQKSNKKIEIINTDNNDDINNIEDGDINNLDYKSKENKLHSKNNNKNNKLINEDDIYLDKIGILTESSANKVNVSKQVKIHDAPILTLFEIMDQPSHTKIYINFPEIKEIKFTKNDFYGEDDKNIKKLIKNGIPKDLIHTEPLYKKRKKISVYTPQKIKSGKKCFIKRKKIINTNNNIQSYNLNSDKMDLNHINIYNNSQNENKFIFSPDYRNMNNMTENNLLRSNENILITNNNREDVELNLNDEAYEPKNEQNCKNEYDRNQLQSNKLKDMLKIYSVSSKRNNSPLFKKKINISKNSLRINNLGRVKNNDN